MRCSQNGHGPRCDAMVASPQPIDGKGLLNSCRELVELRCTAACFDMAELTMVAGWSHEDTEKVSNMGQFGHRE